MKDKRILHINLKSKYFYEIKYGIKTFEYRIKNEYWSKRLENKDYDEIHFKLGYPKATDKDKIIVMPYSGFEIQVIMHPEFGNEPVEVFAIRTNNDYAIQKMLGTNVYTFKMPLHDFIDNNKNKFTVETLPNDLDTPSIQGFNKLMACYYSPSTNMAYWSYLPFVFRDKILTKNREFTIKNIKIIGFDVEYEVL